MRREDIPALTQALHRMAVGLEAALPDRERVEFYFETLADVPLDAVLQGLRTCARRSVHFPKPAEVLEAIATPEGDGHPEPEQAWALSQGFDDENATVTWTAEMAGAYAIARPLVAQGDRIAARMAFVQTYKGLLRESRLAGRTAKWEASLGFDAALRRDALVHARAVGMLTRGSSVTPQIAGATPAPEAMRLLLEGPKGDDEYVPEEGDDKLSPGALAEKKRLQPIIRAAAQEKLRAMRDQIVMPAAVELTPAEVEARRSAVTARSAPFVSDLDPSLPNVDPKLVAALSRQPVGAA